MNENVKEALCDWIFKTATDEELTNFAADIMSRKQREAKMVKELAEFVGFSAVNGKVKPVVQPVEKRPVQPVFAALPVDEAKPKVTNPLIEPPGDASSKIGGETRDKIREHLKDGPETLQGIAGLIKRPSSATQSLMKLLWNRKEVIYDGEKYMLRA